MVLNTFIWNFMNIYWTVLKLYSGHDFVKETATYKVQRDVTQNVSIQELWFLLSVCRLMLVNICMKCHEDILNSFKVIERIWFCLQTSKRRNSKIHIQELWFLHRLHLLVLSICMKFCEYTLNSFKVTEWTCRLMLVNICMKSHEDTWMVLKLQSGHDVVLETAAYKVQRDITQNVFKHKSYGSCTLHVVLCWLIFVWSFMTIPWTVFK